MTSTQTVLESSTKIRFHDCDPFNHLNNARYLDYFMTARGDQLLDYYGFDIYKLAKEQGIGWVSAHTQIAYLTPAYLMEEVLIQTRLIGFSNKHLLLEGVMYNANKSKVKSIMWTKLVHYNLHTRRSQDHNEQLMQLFSQIADTQEARSTFDERLQQLKDAVGTA